MENIEDQASSLYTNIPYHNFGHVLDVLNAGMEIVWQCFSEGVQIDAQVVYYAILFHDAGYHEKISEIDFDTKEEYSAYLAEQVLDEYKLEKGLVRQVKSTIQSTRQDEPFKTNEEKLVRAADLYSLSEDYSIFQDNTIALKKEQEILTEQDISWKEWKERTKDMVDFYLKQDMKLTNAYTNENGESLFHKQAKDNLDKLIEETDESLSNREEVLFPEK